MAKKILSDNIKNKLKGTVDTVKTTVKEAETKLPEVKVPDIKIPDQIKGVFKKKKDDDVTEPSSETPEATTAPVTAISVISTKEAIKIIYYLMAADGEIYHCEEEKFDSIGAELDPLFADNKELIVGECKAQLEKLIDDGDYYDVIQDGIEDAILTSLDPNTYGSVISTKLLVWDLLTIAYSDEQYNETERKLIKYIVRKFNIDKAVFLEMESSILTLLDIEKELNWIKTTDRPYLEIEKVVNELNERKGIIFESVKALILL